jgi:hypothetical protein
MKNEKRVSHAHRLRGPSLSTAAGLLLPALPHLEALAAHATKENKFFQKLGTVWMKTSTYKGLISDRG